MTPLSLGFHIPRRLALTISTGLQTARLFGNKRRRASILVRAAVVRTVEELFVTPHPWDAEDKEGTQDPKEGSRAVQRQRQIRVRAEVFLNSDKCRESDLNYFRNTTKMAELMPRILTMKFGATEHHSMRHLVKQWTRCVKFPIES